jgi:LysM repeat protein
MATEKAFLMTEGGEQIPCLFNPEQFTVGRKNEWTAQSLPGRGVPQLRYAGARSSWMNVDLTFDTTDTGNPVTAYTGKILQLMDVDPTIAGSDEATNNVRPPTVTFNWGDLHSFKAVIAELQMTFTYFSGTGVPLRADMKLVLQQYEQSDAFGPQNPTSGTPRPHRVHRIQPGETLDRISAQYYGDPTRWRALAVANGVEDPLTLRPGALLSIPQLDA